MSYEAPVGRTAAKRPAGAHLRRGAMDVLTGKWQRA